MSTVLLDASVLIPLVIENHTHHTHAEEWFRSVERFATSPITQGSLVRHILRVDGTAPLASAVLKQLSADARHEFWSDDLAYTECSLTGVIGYRQVTDAYLVNLAVHRGGYLATFDKGLASLHPEATVLISR